MVVSPLQTKVKGQSGKGLRLINNRFAEVHPPDELLLGQVSRERHEVNHA